MSGVDLPYLEFGGLEIVNGRRAFLLARQAGIGWLMGPSYPELDASLSADSGFDMLDPTQAPWYDSDQPALCGRFYGVYGLKLEGLYDSTRATQSTENAGDGLVLGSTRKSGRKITATVSLLAKGKDAMEYARTWLAAALELAGCAQSEDCGKADVAIFSTLPTTTAEALTNSRFLKFAEVTSGPFATDEAAVRGIYNTVVEFSFTSERPYLYGPDRQIELAFATQLGLIQDAPINFVPYPAPYLEEDAIGYTRPTISTNADTNPSVELATTNWSFTKAVVSGTDPGSTYIAASADGSARAIGAKGYMVRVSGNGSTVVSTSVTTVTATHDVDITAITAGRLIKLALWAAAAVVAGSSSLVGALAVTAQFLNVSNVQVGSTVTLSTDAAGPGLYSSGRLAIPATATKIRFFIATQMTWTSGTTDAANSDVRLYVDAATVSWGGSA